MTFSSGGAARWTLLALLVLVHPAHALGVADPSYFHSGKIVSGKIIDVYQKPVNLDERGLKTPYEEQFKALLEVDLDPGRGISLYDYILVDPLGREGKCVAVERGPRGFDASEWNIEPSPQTKRLSLMFLVPPPINPGGEVEYKLRFNLGGEFPVPDVKLNLPCELLTKPEREPAPSSPKPKSPPVAAVPAQAAAPEGKTVKETIENIWVDVITRKGKPNVSLYGVKAIENKRGNANKYAKPLVEGKEATLIFMPGSNHVKVYMDGLYLNKSMLEKGLLELNDFGLKDPELSAVVPKTKPTPAGEPP